MRNRGYLQLCVKWCDANHWTKHGCKYRKIVNDMNRSM